MSEVRYVSKVKVEPVEGKARRAYLPVQQEPVTFGVHSEVAEHYGVSPEDMRRVVRWRVRSGTASRSRAS